MERHLDGKDDEIKESLIAVEVFGRRPDYDPKLDSIVRTEAGRLRARLVEDDAREGERDSPVIDLPKGVYRPVFRYRESGLPRRRLWLASAVVLAVIGIGVGWWWRAQARVAPIRIGVLPLENRSPEPGTRQTSPTDSPTRLSATYQLSTDSRFAHRPHLSPSRESRGTFATWESSSTSITSSKVPSCAAPTGCESTHNWSTFAMTCRSGPAIRPPLTDVDFAIQDEISAGIV